MSNNLIGFGAFGTGDVIAPTKSVSITSSIPHSIMMTGGAPSVTVPGGGYQQQLVTPGYDTGYERPPEQGVGPDGGPLMQEQPITNGLPGEAPQLFEEENGLFEQPPPNGDGMDTNTMIGLGLLAAAVLAGGYWFFVAKKPKGETA